MICLKLKHICGIYRSQCERTEAIANCNLNLQIERLFKMERELFIMSAKYTYSKSSLSMLFANPISL